uniref:Uncharacterized protein n=1 Tax=Anopheles merus TaxID=30066 RepID=A0A182URR9_ANOME
MYAYVCDVECVSGPGACTHALPPCLSGSNTDRGRWARDSELLPVGRMRGPCTSYRSTRSRTVTSSGSGFAGLDAATVLGGVAVVAMGWWSCCCFGWPPIDTCTATGEDGSDRTFFWPVRRSFDFASKFIFRLRTLPALNASSSSAASSGFCGCRVAVLPRTFTRKQYGAAAPGSPVRASRLTAAANECCWFSLVWRLAAGAGSRAGPLVEPARLPAYMLWRGSADGRLCAGSCPTGAGTFSEAGPVHFNVLLLLLLLVAAAAFEPRSSMRFFVRFTVPGCQGMSSFSSIGGGALPLRAAPPPAGTHRWPKQATKGPSTMPAQLESQLLQEHWRITPCCSATGSAAPQTSTLLLLAGSTGSTNAAVPLHCCMICADDVQQIGGGSAVLISPADGAIASPGSHWAELFASAAAVSGVSAPPSSTTFLRDASRIAEATATAAASAATEAIGIGTLTASAAPGSVSSGGGAIGMLALPLLHSSSLTIVLTVDTGNEAVDADDDKGMTLLLLLLLLLLVVVLLDGTVVVSDCTGEDPAAASWPAPTWLLLPAGNSFRSKLSVRFGVVVLPARAGFTEVPGWRTDRDGILSCKCTIWFGDTL